MSRRMERAQIWGEQFADHVQRIVFSDEKRWNAHPSKNTRNDRVWINDDETKQDVPIARLKRQGQQHGPALWTWGCVNYNGTGPILLFDQGDRLNSQVSLLRMTRQV